MAELITQSATELARLVRDGEVAAREVVDAHLARIEAVDGDAGYDADAVGETDVHAFLTVTADAARAQADEVDAARARGDELPPLAGVPVAMKDLFVTRGTETTASSAILRGWVPPYDATVVTRLREAGAISVGKTNMDEFAMGSSTETSAYAGHRHRHGWLDPPARRADRHGRDEADLRAHLALGDGRLRVLAGPGRADRAHRRGLRADVHGHGRSRPQGLDVAAPRGR